MYTEYNYSSKKDLKLDVADGVRVRVFQPGGLFPCQRDGIGCVEGPHYPKPHRWYAEVELKDGLVVKVK